MKPIAVDPVGKWGQNTIHRLEPPRNKHIIENNKISMIENIYYINIRSSIKIALYM
jgi:hypothetical protein